jgi:hypothetical protein
MNKRDVILEVQSMLQHGGWQVAKRIVELAEAPAETYKRIPCGEKAKRPMGQAEAARLVAKARARIALVDSTS